MGFLSIGAGLTAWAQAASPQRLNIALTDPSRPAMVKANVVNGSITVKGYKGEQVLIEANQPGLKVEQSDNEVTVQPGPGGPVDLIISVPVKTSLQLKCTNGGNIQVENVRGEIEVNGVNASVTLKHVAGVVLAHSLQGRVLVQMDEVTPGKPMSFTAMNGNIDVSLPAETKADIKLETLNGSLRTEFPVTLTGSISTLGRKLAGAINGGGPEIQLKTVNGSVNLKKSPRRSP